MTDSITPNLGLTLPTVFPGDQWGGKLNANFSAIDLNAGVVTAEFTANTAQFTANAAKNLATVAALLADTTLAYVAGADKVVVATSEIVEAGGFRYQVAASGASDQHVTTAGGVKLYVLPDADGSVSVKAFGAKGNGTTDDTSAVNAAIATTINHIHFPQGTYRLTSLVDVTGENRTISGSGVATSIIHVDHAAGGLRFLGVRQVVKSLRIICQNSAGSAFGISIDAPYFTAKNVFTDWGGVGRFVNGAIVPFGTEAYVRYFENCLFSTTSGAAFQVDAVAFNHAVFIGCTFRSALTHGVDIAGLGCHGVSFHGCRAEENATDGFRIAGRRGNHVSFHGVYLENNGGNGITLGYAAPAWNTDADYMEACHISGLTAWRQGTAAVAAEKCIGVTIHGASIGADVAGFYTNGAIRPGWGTYPSDGPQIKIMDLSRRGAAVDYTLVFGSQNAMVISGEGRDATYDQGWGPSSNITRSGASGGLSGFGVTGAFASNSVTLGRRASLTEPGVSAFASTGSIMGPSGLGAVIACESTDLDAVSGGSSLNLMATSSLSSFNTSDRFRQTVLSSLRVMSANNAAVCGGVAASGSALTANRKWEIDSIAGNITIAGAVTSGHVFADFAEMFENETVGEIPLGVIVTERGGRVLPADIGDEIAGVVTATAAVTAGDSPFAWSGRYLIDEWGQQITEEIPDPDWNGEGDAPLISVPKESLAWNPDLPQIPRSQRPDHWTRVGLLGQVFVRVNEAVTAGDRLSAQGGVGVKSDSPTGLRCMKITQPFDPAKGYAVARCLVNVRV